MRSKRSDARPKNWSDAAWKQKLKGNELKKKYGEITMLDFAKFTKDTFPGLTHMDLWSSLFGDFSGLPPLLFQVGSTEMLLDDSVRAAAKANAAGVPVQLEIWQRMAHVFQLIPALPQTQEAEQNICSFIHRYTGWAG